MIVRQRYPQLAFQPANLFAKAQCLAGQPSILLSQCQVVSLNKTCVDRGAGRRLIQAVQQRLRAPKYQL